MTEFRINIDDFVEKARLSAIQTIETTIRTQAHSLVRGFLSDGHYFGGKEGLAHEIIRKRVEEYVVREVGQNDYGIVSKNGAHLRVLFGSPFHMGSVLVK